MSTFELAAAGDAIINRKLFVDSSNEVERLARIVKQTDAAVVNLEHPISDFKGHPAPGGGSRQSAAPWVVTELEKMGFNLFATATNHSWDFTYEGIEISIDELEERNISFSGIGKTLSDARAPTYIDTDAGRVALISTTATVTPGSEAGMQRPDFRGRPGISPLNVDTRYVLQKEELEQLEQLSENIGLEDLKNQREGHGVPKGYDEDEQFYLMDIGIDDGRSVVFEKGEQSGIRQEVRQKDAEAIKQEIRAANRLAEWVLVSVHAHEGAGGMYGGAEPPAFLENFARICIDEGADAFLGHGPHVIRGIEIYEGAPIFYSLSNLTLQISTIPKFPAGYYLSRGLDYDAHPSKVDPTTSVSRDDNYHSMIPICRFGDDGIEKIELYPVDLGKDLSFPHKGLPRLADAASDEIIAKIEERSRKYETEIEQKDGKAIIDLSE